MPKNISESNKLGMRDGVEDANGRKSRRSRIIVYGVSFAWDGGNELYGRFLDHRSVVRLVNTRLESCWRHVCTELFGMFVVGLVIHWRYNLLHWLRVKRWRRWDIVEIVVVVVTSLDWRGALIIPSREGEFRHTLIWCNIGGAHHGW
jgi:hypothetical protein